MIKVAGTAMVESPPKLLDHAVKICVLANSLGLTTWSETLYEILGVSCTGLRHTKDPGVYLYSVKLTRKCRPDSSHTRG